MSRSEISRKIRTPRFRASFANVFTAKENASGTLKYSTVMLFDKEIAKSQAFQEIIKIVKEVATKKWGTIPPAILQIGSDCCPIKDGDIKVNQKTGEPYDGYQNKYAIHASSKYKIGIVDSGDAAKGVEPQPITSEAEFYSGCFAWATVTAYTWEYMGKRGVSLGLQNIQKLEDGEPLTGASSAEEDFEAIENPSDQSVVDSGLFDGQEAPPVSETLSVENL